MTACFKFACFHRILRCVMGTVVLNPSPVSLRTPPTCFQLAGRFLHATDFLEVRVGTGVWMSAAPLSYLHDGNFHFLVVSYSVGVNLAV